MVNLITDLNKNTYFLEKFFASGNQYIWKVVTDDKCMLIKRIIKSEKLSLTTKVGDTSHKSYMGRITKIFKNEDEVMAWLI